MILYLSLFVFSMLLSALAKRKRSKKISLFIIGTFVVLVVGLRGSSVGIDTEAYYEVYEYIKHGATTNFIEDRVGYLYLFLNKVVALFNGGAASVIFFSVLLAVVPIFVTIYAKSPYVGLSLAIFFAFEQFLFMHNGVRQSIAIAFVFLSFTYYQRNTAKFYMTIVAACLFHATAIFFIVFHYLTRFNVRAVWLLIAWLVSLVFMFMPSVAYQIIFLLKVLAPSQYVHYLTLDGSGAASIGLGVVFRQIVFLMVLIAYKKTKNHAPAVRYLFLMSMISVIVINALLHFGFIFRVAQYASMFTALALPYAIKILFVPRQRPFIVAILTLVCFVFYFVALVNQSHGVMPYNSILNR